MNPLNDRVLSILAFHKIGEPAADGWETWNYVPVETFASYLSQLQDWGWEVIDIAAFVRGLLNPHSLPRRAALLTFDDAYLSTRTTALPWLRRFGMPAVVFAIADLIGGRSPSFDGDNEPDEPLCDWDDLFALEHADVSVQSHGASHRALSRLDAAEQGEEVRRSKAVLEAGLGKSVEVFAYPYGDGGSGRDWRVRRKSLRDALEGAGYRAACLYGGGIIHFPIANPYRLTRVAVGPDTDLDAELHR